MIQVTRINHVPFYLNSDLIEHVEITPDTVITLMNGQKYLVEESAEQVIERIVRFRRQLGQIPTVRSGTGKGEEGR
jgi:flagellar protein FlbD